MFSFRIIVFVSNYVDESIERKECVFVILQIYKIQKKDKKWAFFFSITLFLEKKTIIKHKWYVCSIFEWNKKKPTYDYQMMGK